MNELKKLFEGANGLQPEFLTKVESLLEAKIIEGRNKAIKETEERCETERLELVESHNQKIATLEESFTNGMVEKLDSFLNQAVLEWANENAPAIDSKLKVEMAEKFLTGMTGLFSEAQIAVSGDSEGMIANLQERLQVESARADAAVAEVNTIKESQLEILRTAIISKVCEGLADTQIETVNSLAEGIKVQGDNGAAFESRIKRFRDLVEGKKPEDTKDPKDQKDTKDPKDPKDPKDAKKDDKDETSKEMTESVAAQIAAAMALRG